MSLHPTQGRIAATHVLSFWDAAPAALNAVRRAAMVAHELRVPLHLLVHTAARHRCAQLERFIQQAALHLDVQVRTRRIEGDALTACAPLAENGLLVIPARKRNPLREWLMGSPAERFIRVVRTPVMVVKRAAQEAYRRILVPVDLHTPGEQLVRLAAKLSMRPRIAVFHALALEPEGVTQGLDAPAEMLRARRRQRARWAVAEVGRLADQALQAATDISRAQPTVPVVAFGSAVETILAAETGHQADLIVMGKRSQGTAADFLLGSVTRQVLARCEADVLLVPAERQPEPAPGPHRHRAALHAPR